MGFFNDMLGKTSAKEATQLGTRNAGQINSGYDNANSQSETGYNAAQGRYQPFAAQGQRGSEAYGNALGFNGAGAQQKQFGEFQSSPFMQYPQPYGANADDAIFRRYGAKGQGNSGATHLAVVRAAGERAQGDVNNYYSHLQGAAQMGLGIAGQQAGLDSGYYNGMAERSVGRSNALVNNDTQATQAANNARMAGVNNVLTGVSAIGGTMFKAFAPMPTPGGK